MKRFDDEELEVMLRDENAAPPPDGLLEAIKAEIPESIGQQRGHRSGRVMAIAAAVLVGVGLTMWLSMPRRSARDAAREPSPADRVEERETPPSEPSRVSEPITTAAVEEPPTETTAGPASVTFEETFVIRGVVRDETSAVLPGALVRLEDDIGDHHVTVSGADGSYRFDGLREGDYLVRAELTGFDAAEAPVSLTPPVNAPIAEELVLSVSSFSETVTVAGTTPLIETANASVASAVDDRRATPSTGGTHEPNDAAYDRVFFRHYGVNPFVDAEDDRLSTFAMDVDTASYTVVRQFITDGHLPDPDAVRVEEMVNFFEYGDEPPDSSDFSIHSELAESPFATTVRTRLLRVGVRARTVAPEDRKPVVLTFLVDISGSMNRDDRLGLVKQGLSLLLDGLRSDDRVGLVVFGSKARIVQAPTSDLDRLRRAIHALFPDGSTNMDEGLDMAYEMAAEHFQDDANNRVVLCSDGVANVGDTAWDSLLEDVSSRAELGIELTTLGFGMGNYNDELMEQLADHGDGRYAYIDTLREARRIFGHQITSVLETVARDAKIQVEFEPELVSSYRLLGFENRDIADEDFDNDAIDAGEIGAGHAVTALYEIKFKEERPRQGRVALVRVRYHPVDGGDARETSHVVIDVRSMATSWNAASPSFRLSAVVAEYAELLRGSYWAREGSLDELFSTAQHLVPEFPGRSDVVELVDLIGKARDLRSVQQRAP